jgi:hypothetical protein
MIEEFDHPPLGAYVRWRSNGQWILKQYVAGVCAVVLKSGSGVAIAETPGKTDNGVIYNEDGSLRVRLVNADPRHGLTVFDDVLYRGDELTFIIRGRGVETAAAYTEEGVFIRMNPFQ